MIHPNKRTRAGRFMQAAAKLGEAGAHVKAAMKLLARDSREVDIVLHAMACRLADVADVLRRPPRPKPTAPPVNPAAAILRRLIERTKMEHAPEPRRKKRPRRGWKFRVVKKGGR